MKILLINPDNPCVTLTKRNRWLDINKYRVWKPLSLFTIAKATPKGWDVDIIDENLGRPDYSKLNPDLVGITAFTSQATRAYELSKYFKERGIFTVGGGIHISMCDEEATQYFDSIIKGEAEIIWSEFLDDFKNHKTKKIYEGDLVPIEKISSARHDLLNKQYYTGSIQTTRGCPLRCTFCSVTAFNGGAFRHRPIEHVIEELKSVKEKVILFVDDNLVGVHQTHMDYSKKLFQAMIDAKVTKPWFCQSTINFADDNELLRLAKQSGCFGVFIGFEAIDSEGLAFVHKKFNTRGNRDITNSVQRIQKHGITVTGSFIIGLDTDAKGIGKRIAETAIDYGIDVANVLISTPLPGTVMFDQVQRENRIIAANYPSDWKYYTLAHYVMDFKNLSWEDILREMKIFQRNFYSIRNILKRSFKVRIKDFHRVFLVNINYLYNFILWFRMLKKQGYMQAK